MAPAGDLSYWLAEWMVSSPMHPVEIIQGCGVVRLNQDKAFLKAQLKGMETSEHPQGF